MITNDHGVDDANGIVDAVSFVGGDRQSDIGQGKEFVSVFAL